MQSAVWDCEVDREHLQAINTAAAPLPSVPVTVPVSLFPVEFDYSSRKIEFEAFPVSLRVRCEMLVIKRKTASDPGSW